MLTLTGNKVDLTASFVWAVGHTHVFMCTAGDLCVVLTRSRWQFVGGPFSRDIPIQSNLFVLSPNNKYLVSGGHWDNSFRVHLVERGKLSARIAHHNGTLRKGVG